jgi:hypothetical protein
LESNENWPSGFALAKTLRWPGLHCIMPGHAEMYSCTELHWVMLDLIRIRFGQTLSFVGHKSQFTVQRTGWGMVKRNKQLPIQEAFLGQSCLVCELDSNRKKDILSLTVHAGPNLSWRDCVIRAIARP